MLHSFFNVLSDRFPDLLTTYQKLYPPGSYAPAKYNWREIALLVRELCTRQGIHDRMPRPIIPGDGRATNRRIVELLANQCYSLELENAASHRIWAALRAAWAIEDLEQDIQLIYSRMGLKGLQSIPNVGPSLAGSIEALIGIARSQQSR